MSFPSLRLPLVVLSIIFNCMRPEEIIRFSFLSKRCYTLTKTLKKKPKRGLDIMFCSYASIEFLDSFSTRFEVSEFSDIPEDAQLEFLVIGGTLPCFVSMNRKRDGMDLYCQYDRFDGLTALLKYIIDFYELPIENISIGADKHTKDPKRALDWVFSQQEALNECYFDCDRSSDEELQYLFDRIGNRVEKFLGVLMTSNVGENFRYTFSNEDETERRFTFSYELTRYDGTIASVLLGNRSFCMCVWPDFDGKLYPVQELEE
ncbi:hypothetical protein CAEBREN_07386 [Caenorhabditis brenneri]|uniref:F-box domain-containing protein n=1 Tax=Caenorhabditis brenneri TaxID=135651 RepID=G0N2T9_CAEBE|nr:hypothetical protein CAEBREN_07386 [Caenorhabditis brenneri]